MKKILIIEDDLDLQEGLAFSLKSEGYEIITAGSAEEGWNLLVSRSCNFILLDCNLPDGNGFDLCQKIKSYTDTPILMLTARDTEMDEVKALELGVDDFMSKPFSLAVLKARIKKLLFRNTTDAKRTSNGITIETNTCRIFKNHEEIICSKNERFPCYSDSINSKGAQIHGITAGEKHQQNIRH